MRLIFLAISLMFYSVSFPQEEKINQKSLDSLVKAIESHTKSTRSWQDSFTRSQDSIYQLQLSRLNQQKEGQEKNHETNEKTILAWLIAGTGLAALIWALWRNSERSRPS